MPFLYPLYLLGTVAAGIPILIHMIHKRKAQRVLFPTIRFLKSSNERTSRRQRIQDLLLLLLRVLLLILLALALSQPFLGTRRLGLGRRIHAVILLDNSYSMATEHERKARFDAAKEMAAIVVDALPDGSQATLMLSCPPHKSSKPILSDDREKLRRDILKAPVSQARADMTAAVARAYDLLAKDESPTLEVYAITDLQRNAWSPPPPAEPAKAAKVEPNLVIIDCGRDDYRNLAISELIVRAGARVRGRPVGIQAKIHNYSPKTISVNTTLYVDRAKQANQQIDIPANLTATASFNHVFANAGIHTGWVQIDDDSLAIDNRRDLAIEVQDHIPALLLREQVPGIPQLDPAFFINKALDPYADDATQSRSLVQATTTDISQLSHDLLKPYKVVLLVDVGGLRPSHIAVLRRYVRHGGRLVIFCGPATRAKNLGALLNAEDPTNALMPLTVHEPAQGVVDRRQFKTLIGLDYDHTALRIFKGYRLPQTAKVYNYVPIDVPQNSPTRILISLSDANPFLLENTFHKGRVVLCTTTTDPDWSNLAASRFFLPLIHRLVYYLTERDDIEGTHIVGAPVSITLREINHPVTIQLRDPDGDVLDLPARPSGGATRATFEHTDKRGPYTYLILDPKAAANKTPDDAKTEAQSAFAVNVDHKESDLAKIPTAELSKLLAGRRTHFAATPSELRASIQRMREGIPLRNFLLYIVLFIAIFETFFANRVMPALAAAEEARTAPPTGPAEPTPAEAT